MNILAVDDEPLMLWQLTENLKRIFEKPEYRVSGFDEVDDVMEWLDAQEKGSIAYAFLDIKLRGMSGIELAKDIRERSPKTKVIFCTAYSDYAMEAFSVHAVGYLLKPVSEGDIRDVGYVSTGIILQHGCQNAIRWLAAARAMQFHHFEMVQGSSSSKDIFHPVIPDRPSIRTHPPFQRSAALKR